MKTETIGQFESNIDKQPPTTKERLADMAFRASMGGIALGAIAYDLMPDDSIDNIGYVGAGMLGVVLSRAMKARRERKKAEKADGPNQGELIDSHSDF